MRRSDPIEQKNITALKWGEATHAGRKEQNEDCYGIANLPANPLGARSVAVLADGMGGYNAGEVASAIAVKSILGRLCGAISGVASTEQLHEVIAEAVETASDEIYQHALKHPACRGMGTTIAVVLCGDSWLAGGNVGDSRIYLLAEGAIAQISEDHTALAEALQARELSAEELRDFPYKHTITRCLGNQEPPQTYCYVCDALSAAGAIIMLCSDGVTDVLDDREILRHFDGAPTVQTAAENIVRRAFHQHSRDNITVVALEHGNYRRGGTPLALEPPIVVTPAAPPPRKKSGKSLWLPLLAGLLVLLLAAVGSLAYYLYTSKPVALPVFEGATPQRVSTPQPDTVKSQTLEGLKDKIILPPPPVRQAVKAGPRLKASSDKATKSAQTTLPPRPKTDAKTTGGVLSVEQPPKASADTVKSPPPADGDNVKKKQD
jgi:PPM family protein phosphatase